MISTITEARKAIALTIMQSPLEEAETNVTSIVNEVIHSEGIKGSADQYHNLGAELARIGYYSSACDILDKGLMQHPKSVDLLSDYLEYGIKCDRLEKCNVYFNKIQSIDKKLWTWRGFDFSLDYLKYMVEQKLSNGDMLNDAITDIDALIEDFMKFFPFDERPYLAKADIHIMLADAESAINALIEGAEKIKVAPRCCLRYADIMLERGEYSDVIKYAQKGIRASMQEQEVVSTGYLYYISGLAKDALAHKENGLDVNSVESILTDYRIAYRILEPDKTTYRGIIEKRVTILEIESGKKCELKDNI